MIKTLSVTYIRALLRLLGGTQPARDGWRSMAGESMITPLGEIHAKARPTGAAARLEALLAPVIGLLGREPARAIKSGKVSGVYYPID